MTFEHLLKKGVEALGDSGTENAVMEAKWLLEAVLGCDKNYLFFNMQTEAESSAENDYMSRISQRASGRPIQYIIGEWDFYGENFSVGEGVLIPRPETELLVDFAADYLKSKQNAVVLDLCAGSGCVGLTVARLFPMSTVFLIEKSPEAFVYLEKNKKRLGCENAIIISGDIFSGFASFDIPLPDLILSNPPYIPASELPQLQHEVLHEPAMALDGGDDGLDFYRAIAEKWLDLCNAAAVECGEGQAEQIKAMFSRKGKKAYSIADFNGIDRVVAVITEHGKENENDI